MTDALPRTTDTDGLSGPAGRRCGARVAVLIATFLLAACTGAPGAAPSAVPSLKPAGVTCPGAVLPGEAVRFGAAAALAGALIGAGTNAIVLAHQAPGRSASG